jgi:chromosome segregation ATPase
LIGRRPTIRPALGVCLLVTGGGCTLAQMQQESGQMTTRIADKEANLTQLENQRAALAVERAKLLSDLDNKDVTLNQLLAGLERLKQENRRLRSDTEQQQRDKHRVDADIQKLQAEINRVDVDDSVSDKMKKEKIEALKKQIKAYLQLMLTQ